MKAALIRIVCATTLLGVHLAAAAQSRVTVSDNPKILWGKDAGIVPPTAADIVEKIVSRSGLAITDTFANVARKNRGGDKYPHGFLLGNGDATVSLKDEKGKWVFCVSPLDYWWGAPVNNGKGTITHGVAGWVAVEIPELRDWRTYTIVQDIYRAELRGEFASDSASVKMTARVLRGSRNRSKRHDRVCSPKRKDERWRARRLLQRSGHPRPRW